MIQHQPSKALPYLLRLRRPEVFDFIKEHNLFASVQDQVLLLIDFDKESEPLTNGTINERKEVTQTPMTSRNEPAATTRHGKAIALLIDHTYSIPVSSAGGVSDTTTESLLVDIKGSQPTFKSSKVSVHVPGRAVPQRSPFDSGLQRPTGKLVHPGYAAYSQAHAAHFLRWSCTLNTSTPA